MDRLVDACPECDSPEFYGIVGSPVGDAGTDHDYRCRQCGEAFDEPAHREAKADSGGSDMTRRLERMDPDDLGGEA
ncbi:hypothetical protein ACFQL1_16065 [Halomicroarcula sp. GCM10025709]|uniref:hypothetical protein n=1 Tax=Haloarcula TaxID=2237 RepID=UPI0024C45294|nr:hypothetical protein [Halomicroarcula sp. YJ-61-S]